MDSTTRPRHLASEAAALLRRARRPMRLRDIGRHLLRAMPFDDRMRAGPPEALTVRVFAALRSRPDVVRVGHGLYRWRAVTQA